jgi:proline iminopeptidase
MPSFPSYDGTKISYSEVGSGPRLVCLPGGPGRAAAYLEDLGGLAADRTLVLLDMRATGRSEVPADPSTLRFDRLGQDVEALRVHLGEERLDLLAHSAGTIVAQAWAALHPHAVASLVLVTPSGHLQGSDRQDVPALVESRKNEPWYAEAREALDALEHAPPSMQQQLWRSARPFMYGRWDDRTQAHAATAETQTSKRAALAFQPLRAEDVDVSALLTALAAVTAPVLVVGGGRDALTGVAAVHAVASSFPTATAVVLPEAGHFPWVDEPVAFAEAVREFLAGV